MREAETWEFFLAHTEIDNDAFWDKYKRAAWERKWWQKYITDWIPRIKVKVDLTVRVWMPPTLPRAEKRERDEWYRRRPWIEKRG